MYESLQAIIQSGKSVTVDTLNNDENILAAIEIQTRLCNIGILDPIVNGDWDTPFGPVAKADGVLGINSRAALFEFSRLLRLPYTDRLITLDLARNLIWAKPDTFLPVEFDNKTTDDISTRLAKRVLRHMRKKGYWIARSPNMFNIVYVEGINADGSLNNDNFNEWNDRRLVIRIALGGKPQLVVNDQSTTEPGRTYTQYPQHPLGAARIAFGQYKAWTDGLHNGWQPALIQRGKVKVHRDLNKNGMRGPTDPIDIGTTFGINQHSTSTNQIPAMVGPFSAGCLVGRRYAWHLLFLKTVKKDIRFQMNKSYLFMTAVISGEELREES